MAEVQSRLDVATAERDLLTQQQTDAKQRLQVDFIHLLPKSTLSDQHFIAPGSPLLSRSRCIYLHLGFAVRL